MRNDLVKLIAIKSTKDADGFPVKSEKQTDVFADIKSGGYSERYAAASVGIKIELIATVNEYDYKEAFDGAVKPTELIYDGVRYKILDFTYFIRKKKAVELKLSRGE